MLQFFKIKSKSLSTFCVLCHSLTLFVRDKFCHQKHLQPTKNQFSHTCIKSKKEKKGKKCSFWYLSSDSLTNQLMNSTRFIFFLLFNCFCFRTSFCAATFLCPFYPSLSRFVSLCRYKLNSNFRRYFDGTDLRDKREMSIFCI